MRFHNLANLIVRRGLIAAAALCLLAAATGPVMAASAHAALPNSTLQNPHLFPSSSGSGSSSTSGKPGIAACHGELYVAWTGSASPYHMLISHTTTPTTPSSWSTPQVLNDSAIQTTGPALACYLNRLYIAWAGTDSSHHLNVGYYTDGNAALNSKHTLTDSTLVTPDIAPFSVNGRLYLVWKGTNNTHINLESSVDGATWDVAGSKFTFVSTVESVFGPSITEFNCSSCLSGDQMRVAWTDYNASGPMYVFTGWFNGTTTLQDVANTFDQPNFEPDLVAVGTSLYDFYSNALGGDAQLTRGESPDGSYWFDSDWYNAGAPQDSATDYAGHAWLAYRLDAGPVYVAETA